jgi:ribosome-binding protein aMBF1 (putative translation factor)
MKTLNRLKKEWLKNPDIRAEYDALAEEFSLAEALIRARAEADMTQAQVAEKMRTSQSYVAKLESGQVSPSMKALQRYAAATGARLKITLEHPA